MICSIMQPTYLPWAGYFNLIVKSDIFIFLDDAQLQKNSWHNRNRILVNQQPHWITVPVKRISLEQTIKATEIDNSQFWRKKQIKLLKQTYAKHPFGNDISDLFDIIELEDIRCLGDLNIRLIKAILDKLNITKEIYLSSMLDTPGLRTERLIAILEKLKVDTYLSPQGASEYLELDGFNDLTSINLEFQKYTPVPYKQYQADTFESHLSIVDVIANIGWKATKDYIS